jgi:hypothetical protein
MSWLMHVQAKSDKDMSSKGFSARAQLAGDKKATNNSHKVHGNMSASPIQNKYGWGWLQCSTM